MRKKNWDNLKSLNVKEGPGFINCHNFGTVFCRDLKIKIFFLKISQANPCPLPFGIHCQSILPKNMRVQDIFRKKEKK